ncbi:hypothetical protein FB567DRAFT_333284 [Paraphoma chrysanthemicola]|uniref:Uncharacterized protein n=1 Tax=Paraphoma chrysanthemicola TaxID=798071 RepID=A0A8K0R6T2_9PLEO|nr:hypothetical protein FB567DRAFT_333284 [Paraphoma chrysanthemicola]
MPQHRYRADAKQHAKTTGRWTCTLHFRTRLLLAQPYAWGLASRGYESFAPSKCIDGLAWRVVHGKKIRYRLVAQIAANDQVAANLSGALPRMRIFQPNHPAITTLSYHNESRSQSTAHITPQLSKLPLSSSSHPGKAAKQTRECSLPSRFRLAPLYAPTVSSPRTTTCADCVGEFTTNCDIELESFSDSILALHDACGLKYAFPAYRPRGVEVRERTHHVTYARLAICQDLEWSTVLVDIDYRLLFLCKVLASFTST